MLSLGWLISGSEFDMADISINLTRYKCKQRIEWTSDSATARAHKFDKSNDRWPSFTGLPLPRTIINEERGPVWREGTSLRLPSVDENHFETGGRQCGQAAEPLQRCGRCGRQCRSCACRLAVGWHSFVARSLSRTQRQHTQHQKPSSPFRPFPGSSQAIRSCGLSTFLPLGAVVRGVCAGSYVLGAFKLGESASSSIN